MKILNSLKKLLYKYTGSFPYYGVKVYFPRNSLIFKMAYDQGVYEQEILRLMMAIVKPDTFYFDVGANIGLMSIPVLDRINNCRVVSFEPSPNTIPYLLRTQAKSNFRDRWLIVDKAAGDKIGNINFHICNPDLGAFDSFNNTGRFSSRSVVRVPMTTIDEEWRLLGCPPVSLIKIDVEGAERIVLNGAQACINIARPYILLEWNLFNMAAYNFNADDLLSISENMRYEVLTIPYFIPIINKTVFRAQMLLHENFLLAPKS